MEFFSMIALLQRVIHASVTVENKIIGAIDSGLLVFIGVEREDQEKNADRLLERILGYRIFSDAADKMNLSVQDVKGGLLLVPQFTLAADTKKGMRPSFTSAASPEHGQKLFNYLLNQAKQQHLVAAGQFGAHMQVNLCNDGPVTFLLRV
jgi:D-tyrosyl-tRNA(Tyr) deacylase